VANFGVTGPYFFEDEDGRAVPVTSARYVEMVRNFLTPEVSRGIELSTIRFQQDGATAHTAIASMEVIREMFTEHVVSLHGEPPWSARSPDLSACDYFILGVPQRKCTPLDHGPSMTSRSQFGSKFQRYQKTWRGEHWETCEQGWKIVYAMMGSVLVMCYSK
jgi:hypothetical protein